MSKAENRHHESRVRGNLARLSKAVLRGQVVVRKGRPIKPCRCSWCAPKRYMVGPTRQELVCDGRGD